MEDSFVNIGEVILTLLWQSGLLNQRLYVISLSICYWLFKCGVLRVVCVCVCVRERVKAAALCVCVCACVCERVRQGHTTTACVQTHTSFITVSVTRLCSTSKLELNDGKTKVIINCLYLSFECWSSQLWKGELHFWRGLWCSANQKALGQLANQRRLRLSEGGTL